MKHGWQLQVQARDRLLSIGSPLLLILFWEFAVRANWLDSRFFPPPSTVVAALVDLTAKGDLMGKLWLLPGLVMQGDWDLVQKTILEGHLWVSLFRVFSGFVLGAFPGIILGVLMGMSRSVRVAIDPIISAVYVLPKIAILPLIMLLFGIGETSKIVTVGISSFFLVLINTTVGVRDIEPIFFEAARNYGANRWQTFWHVIIPGALPVIFAGLRLSLGTGLIVIIAAEFVTAQYGLGYLIWFSWQMLLTENMFAGLVVVMLIGVLFTAGLQFIERRMMPWRREERTVVADAADASIGM